MLALTGLFPIHISEKFQSNGNLGNKTAHLMLRKFTHKCTQNININILKRLKITLCSFN